MPKFKDDEIFKVKIPLVKNDEEYSESISIKELRDLILTFIKNSEGRNRQEINEYIYPILNDEKDIMNNRVRTTLTYLRKNEFIENIGTDTKSMWISK